MENITKKIAEELKERLQKLLENLGMDMTTFYFGSAIGSRRTEFTISTGFKYRNL